MAWLDDRFPLNPKVVRLGDRAFRAYVEGLCYCSAHGTHGVLDGFMKASRTHHATAKELARKGLWERMNGSWTIHGWDDYNARYELKRLKDRDRQRKRRETMKRDMRDTSQQSHSVTSHRIDQDLYKPPKPPVTTAADLRCPRCPAHVFRSRSALDDHNAAGLHTSDGSA